MPAKYLKEYTFIHAGKELVNISSKEMEDKVSSLVKDVDLVYIKHIDNPYAVISILGACDYYNKPLIVDFDDDVFTTDNLAPEKYTYTKESQHYHNLEVLLQNCTAITVSTSPLIKRYEKFNKNIHLVPNACDMSDWKFESRHHERVTVGWAGSASHVVDHPVLEQVYQRVVEKYPEVVFSFVGHMLPDHIKGMKRKNWEIKPGISWWEGNPENDMTYPRLLAECGYDVGLAPIIKSQFNASRSLVKWFEYTMVGVPVVASKWGPYLDLDDGNEAYLVDSAEEWAYKINNLIQNKDDRKRLITNARERIERDYSIERIIPIWREIFSNYISKGFRASN